MIGHEVRRLQRVVRDVEDEGMDLNLEVGRDVPLRFGKLVVRGGVARDGAVRGVPPHVLCLPTSGRACAQGRSHAPAANSCTRTMAICESGGMSSLVSAAAIYNAILERRPDLLDIYYQQFCYAHLGEDKTTPIFSFHHGKLSCRYLRQYIELGYEQMSVPLSPLVKEALDVFDDIMMSPDMRIDMMMEPGDMQFANNYMVLHSRTAFDDHVEQDLRRKKLRLWLKMENARLLAPEFPGRNGFGVPAYL